MDDSKGCQAIVGLTISLFLLIATCAIYGFKNGLLVFFVLGILTKLVSLAGFVPIIGPFIYWGISKNWLFPQFFIWFDSIHPTWVTTTILVLGLIASIGYTLIGCGLGRRNY
ncbi:MAG: hypothetical protein AB1414_04305 [bacterium]